MEKPTRLPLLVAANDLFFSIDHTHHVTRHLAASNRKNPDGGVPDHTQRLILQIINKLNTIFEGFLREYIRRVANQPAPTDPTASQWVSFRSASTAIYRQESGIPGDAAGAAQAYSSADGTNDGWRDADRLDRDDARLEVALCSFGADTAQPRKPLHTRFVVCDWTPVFNEINHLRAGSVELKINALLGFCRERKLCINSKKLATFKALPLHSRSSFFRL